MLCVRSVVVVLALFVTSVVVSSLAPIVGGGHAPGHDDAVLALADAAAPVTGELPDGDGIKCNHGCHFLQHFQGSVDRSPLFILDRSPATYAAVEPDPAPQLVSDTRFRPPRVPARSA